MKLLAARPNIKISNDSTTPKSYIEVVAYNAKLRQLVAEYRSKNNISPEGIAEEWVSESKMKEYHKVSYDFVAHAKELFNPPLDHSWQNVLSRYLLFNLIDEIPYDFVGFKNNDKSFARKVHTTSGKISYRYTSSEKGLSLEISIVNALKARELDELKHLLLDLTSPLNNLDWPSSTRMKRASLIMDLRRKYPDSTIDQLGGLFASEYPSESSMGLSSNEVKDYLKLAKLYSF